MAAKQSQAWLSPGQQLGQAALPVVPAGGYTGLSPALQKPRLAKQSQLWSEVALKPLPGQQWSFGALPQATHSADGTGSPVAGLFSTQPGQISLHCVASGIRAGGEQNPMLATQSVAREWNARQRAAETGQRAGPRTGGARVLGCGCGCVCVGARATKVYTSQQYISNRCGGTIYARNSGVARAEVGGWLTAGVVVGGPAGRAGAADLPGELAGLAKVQLRKAVAGVVGGVLEGLARPAACNAI